MADLSRNDLVSDPNRPSRPEAGIDDGLHEVIGLAVVRTTPTAVVSSYNAVAGRLLGWTDHNGVGRSFSGQVIERPDASESETLRDLLGAGRPWAGLVSYPPAGPAQALGTAPATAVPMHDADGLVVGAVVMWLELDSALWPLLTGTLDGWLVVHNGGRVTYASRYATWLLGGTAREIQELGVTSPGLVAAEQLGTFLAQRAGGDLEAATEFRAAGTAGPGRWIEATVAGTNSEGPLAGVLWRLRDVTGRRRLDGRQRARSAELQYALDSRVVIEQAKGFLAGRDGDSPEAAFLRLRRYARDHNVGLREVSRQLLAGEIGLGTTP